MPLRIFLPDEIEGLQLIVSASGGKDSTALLLALREAGLPHRAVFADTRWEAPETYAYLDLLRERLGIVIDVVYREGGMLSGIERRAGFPGRQQRWCTRELKIEPLRDYHDEVEQETGIETVSVLGIRGAESADRAKQPELEDEPPGRRSWGGWVWRPLSRWSVGDVLRIHHRHGLPVNPLYLRGHDRVGCYPCVYANKEDIRLMAEHSPERVRKIRALEQEMTAERGRRNEQEPGRYAHPLATFFQSRIPKHRDRVTGKRTFAPMTIDEVVTWSRTTHGGRQLSLLAPPPTGGCMRWGLCDPVVASDDGPAEPASS